MFLDRLRALAEQNRLTADNADASGAGAAGGGGAAATAGAAAGAAGGAGASGTAAAGTGAAGTAASAGADDAAAAAWRDDWREALSAGDDKKLARLKRFASPENVFRSYLNLEQRVSSGQLKPVALPDAATPEEIAEYRQQLGIPEAPEGYGLEFPQGVTPSEADKAELAAFAEKMHAAHMPPGAVKAAYSAFNELVEEAQQRRHEALRQQTVAAQATLRSEFGRDYARNTQLANDFLAEGLAAANTDPALGPQMMGWRLADGTALGDHPEFVRTMVHLARKYADEEALIGGETTGGKSLDDEYKEMIAAQAKDPKKAEDKDFQARLLKIAEARVARNERQGRARAA